MSASARYRAAKVWVHDSGWSLIVSPPCSARAEIEIVPHGKASIVVAGWRYIRAAHGRSFGPSRPVISGRVCRRPTAPCRVESTLLGHSQGPLVLHQLGNIVLADATRYRDDALFKVTRVETVLPTVLSRAARARAR